MLYIHTSHTYTSSHVKKRVFFLFPVNKRRSTQSPEFDEGGEGRREGEGRGTREVQQERERKKGKKSKMVT